MKDPKEKALQNEKKFHCFQAVFGAFPEKLGIEETTAFKIRGCFGGFICCGELSGDLYGDWLNKGHRNFEDSQNEFDTIVKIQEQK